MSAPSHPHLRVVTITLEQVAKAIDDKRLDRDTAVRLLATTAEEVARLREENATQRLLLEEAAHYAHEADNKSQSIEYRQLAASSACLLLRNGAKR